MKPLKLGYEIFWRTKGDERRMGKATWKKIRLKIFERDNFTCVYCEYRNSNISENEVQVNHVDGYPKNNSEDNLETVCRDCHRVLHGGFWGLKQDKLEVYQESKYGQKEIITRTRELRAKGKTDEEIREFLGLKGRVPWVEDRDYLSGFSGSSIQTLSRRCPSDCSQRRNRRSV